MPADDPLAQAVAEFDEGIRYAQDARCEATTVDISLTAALAIRAALDAMREERGGLRSDLDDALAKVREAVEGRKRVRYEVKDGECFGCGSDIHDCYCGTWNAACDEVLAAIDRLEG